MADVRHPGTLTATVSFPAFPRFPAIRVDGALDLQLLGHSWSAALACNILGDRVVTGQAQVASGGQPFPVNPLHGLPATEQSKGLKLDGSQQLRGGPRRKKADPYFGVVFPKPLHSRDMEVGRPAG